MERFRAAGGVLPEEREPCREALEALGRFHEGTGTAAGLPERLAEIPEIHDALGEHMNTLQQRREPGASDLDLELAEAIRLFCAELADTGAVHWPLLNAARDAMMRTERYVSLRETFKDTETSAGVQSPILPLLLPQAADAEEMKRHLEALRKPHTADRQISFSPANNARR